MVENQLTIGCRIHCDGEYGTVLYIGEIEGMEGTWLGIEWDNPARGKHSGCYKNINYFSTSVPNAGSFIKISKADVGISCPEAIRIKYGQESDSSKPPQFVNLPQKSGASRHIEMVGMEKIKGKQSNFLRLTDIVLSGMLINRAGENEELKNLVPNVKNLDLSQNLLSSWEEVTAIVHQLPKLSGLILSKNRLRIPSDCKQYQDSYLMLKLLVVNNMAYSWEEVLSCASMWPYIEELSVLDNRITSLEPPKALIFSKLKLLSLDNNSIGLWSEINKLGELVTLEELHLENTSLESVEFPIHPSSESTYLFPNLKILFLSNNKLTDWSSIGELNKLKSLKKLMITKNPVLQSLSPQTTRQLIIAKIQRLEILNRTQIDRSERRGAELDYLKRYRSDWVSSGGTNNQLTKLSDAFLKEHPTYLCLLQKHGAAEANEVEQSVLIKDNLICVKIFSPLMPDKPILTRKLPVDMTVGKLKALVQRIFKVAANEVTLTRVFKEDDSKRTEIDNDLRLLSYYSLSDQDKISVEW